MNERVQRIAELLICKYFCVPRTPSPNDDPMLDTQDLRDATVTAFRMAEEIDTAMSAVDNPPQTKDLRVTFPVEITWSGRK